MPQRIAELAVVIHQQLVVDAPLVGEVVHLVDVVERVDADEANLIAEVGLDGGEVRQLTGARRARRVPQVDDHRPPVGTATDAPSTIRQLDVGKRIAVVRRVRRPPDRRTPRVRRGDHWTIVATVVGDRCRLHTSTPAPTTTTAASTTTWARSADAGWPRYEARSLITAWRGPGPWGGAGGDPAPPRGLLVRRRSRRGRRRARR